MNNTSLSSLSAYFGPIRLKFYRELFEGCCDMYSERELMIKKALSGKCLIKFIEVLPSEGTQVAETDMDMFFYYGGGTIFFGSGLNRKIIVGDSYHVSQGGKFHIFVEEEMILKGIVICSTEIKSKKNDPRYFASASL